MFRVFSKIFRLNPTSTKQILFFGAIFTIYFISSVGVMNTLDGAQFFTTEALMQYKTVDLKTMLKYNHFYSQNDLAYKDNQILPVRGFMHIVFTAPLHVVGKYLQILITTHNYPKHIADDPNFKYELIINSLFAIFPTLGLFFLWRAIKENVERQWISYLITFFTAFGTYIWKYSTYYTRQGLLVLIFGLYVYLTSKIIRSKSLNNIYFYTYILFSGILFGLDNISLVSSLVPLAFIVFIRFFLNSPTNTKAFIKGGLMLAIMIAINTMLNLHFFGSFSYQLYDFFTIQKGIITPNVYAFLASTPFFPTIWWAYILLRSATV